MDIVYAIGDLSNRLMNTKILNMRYAYVQQLEKAIRTYMEYNKFDEVEINQLNSIFNFRKEFHKNDNIADYIALLNEIALSENVGSKLALCHVFNIDIRAGNPAL